MSETLQEKLARLNALRQEKEKVEVANPTAAPTLPDGLNDKILQATADLETIPDFEPQKFLQKLAIMDKALEVKAPGISEYLFDIKNDLNKYPEIAHALNEDQLHAIVSGLLFTNNINASVLSSGKVKKTLTIDQGKQIFG